MLSFNKTNEQTQCIYCFSIRPTTLALATWTTNTRVKSLGVCVLLFIPHFVCQPKGWKFPYGSCAITQPLVVKTCVTLSLKRPWHHITFPCGPAYIHPVNVMTLVRSFFLFNITIYISLCTTTNSLRQLFLSQRKACFVCFGGFCWRQMGNLIVWQREGRQCIVFGKQ